MIVTTSARRTSRFSGLAELPRAEVDFSFPTVTGTTRNVSTTGQFDTALAAAVDGDEIVIGANLTYTINLPNRGTTGTVLIRSDNSAWASASSTRVTANTNMRTITATGSPLRCVTTATGARGYRFVGIEFKFPSSGSVNTNLIDIGNGESSESDLPSYIIFDRCYIHGDATNGGRRGIAANGKHVGVTNCYIFDFKEVGADTQAVWIYNTPGPITVINSYLEAAGENFMSGGADSAITNCVPADITFRKCHLKKPTSWVGSSWTVKNIFEIKNAKRVLVEQCLFENIWKAAQAGFCFNLKPTNQDGGTGTWATCEDVTIRYNKIKNAENGFALTGYDDVEPGQRGARVHIHNNVAEIVLQQDTQGWLLQLLSLGDRYTIEKNTLVHKGTLGTLAGYVESVSPYLPTNLLIRDNILTSGSGAGFDGPSAAEGTATFNLQATSWTFVNNALIANGNLGNYPATNIAPATTTAAKFTNFAGGDYTLASDSPMKSAASDGGDMGANVSAVEAYATAAEAG